MIEIHVLLEMLMKCFPYTVGDKWETWVERKAYMKVVDINEHIRLEIFVHEYRIKK